MGRTRIALGDDETDREVKARIALLTAVAALLVALYVAGFFDLMSDRERLRVMIDDLGVWGPLVFILAFALLEPFFVPGFAFMAPGALVWSAPELFFYSLLGSTGAGIVGFSFARYLGRDFVASRLPPRLLVWNERLERSGLRTVIVLRVVFFLAPPVHWLLGLSSVSFSVHALGTVIGFAPGMAVMSWMLVEVGATLFDWFAAQPAAAWWLLAAVVVGVAVLRRIWLARRRRALAAAGVEEIE